MSTKRSACTMTSAAIAVLTSFVAISALALQPADPVAPIVAQVQSLSRQFDDAAMQNDIVTMSRLLSMDYEAVTATGRVQHKNDILEAHRYGRVHYEDIDTRESNIEIDGDTAIEHRTSFVKGTYKGVRFDGRYASTRTFKRQPSGRWLIVSLIVNYAH